MLRAIIANNVNPLHQTFIEARTEDIKSSIEKYSSSPNVNSAFFPKRDPDSFSFFEACRTADSQPRQSCAEFSISNENIEVLQRLAVRKNILIYGYGTAANKTISELSKNNLSISGRIGLKNNRRRLVGLEFQPFDIMSIDKKKYYIIVPNNLWNEEITDLLGFAGWQNNDNYLIYHFKM